MRFSNKWAVIAVLLCGSIACSDVTELDEFLDSPNQVPLEEADAEFLYNSIQLKFAEVFMGQGSNSVPGTFQTTPDLFNFASDLTRMTALDGGSIYQNAFQPTYFDALWTDVYADLFPDVQTLTEAEDLRDITGYIGTAKILKAYTMMMLVDIFGDVPYSQIGQGRDLISPPADSGEEVYAAALSLLDEAIADISGEDSNLPATQDNFYGGNLSRWITLANTLKLRAAVTTRLVDQNAATTIDALLEDGNIIDDTSEDWEFSFGSNRLNPSTRHPLYVNSYETFDGNYLGNYFMWVVSEEKLLTDSIQDPRANYYFYRQEANLTSEIALDPNAFDCILGSGLPTRNDVPSYFTSVDPNLPYCLGSALEDPAETGYFGRDHGNNSGIPPDGQYRTVYGVYPAGGLYDDGSSQFVQNFGTDGAEGDGILPLMLSSYVHFLRAEAALTLGTSDNAAEQLEAGIRASFAKVSGFAGAPVILDTLVADYINYVMAEFDGADSDEKLDILGKEFYIALWGQPYEHYNLYRRTCAPENFQPLLENPQDGQNFIQSAFYPVVYVARNQTASQKENTQVEVFWDTNDGSCNY